MTDSLQVFLFALLTAVATGLGALPFLLFKNPARSWLGVSNALAVGLMLAASFGLVYEGVAYGLWRTVLGMMLGLLFIVISRRLIQHDEHPAVFAGMGAFDARKALLIVGVMTLHSFTEGVAIGVSFGGGEAFGIFIALALAVHNIPEGLAISLILVPRGTSARTAAAWSVFSSLPQPLMAVPAFLFVEAFSEFLPVGLGFAAGAMIWLVVADLLPEALETSRPAAVASTTAVSAIAMLVFMLALL